MPRAARLKVYRTPIGFHDAYVAAPSQKAALAAWGSAHDLFATGEAELVTDAAITAEPLARPGEIVRRVRGTTAEHIAALPAEPEAQSKPPRRQPRAPAPRKPVLKAGPPKRATARPKPAPRPPKPTQGAVNAAKAALSAGLDQQRRERSALAQRERDLQRERQQLEAAHRTAEALLRKAVKTSEANFAKALAKWRRASKTSSAC